MKSVCFRVLTQNKYLIFGTVVVGAVTFMTGLFIPSVIGYTASVGIIALAERLVK